MNSFSLSIGFFFLLFLPVYGVNSKEDGMMKKEVQIQVAARALVVADQKLLLVSHTPEYWYTPGGRLEVEESLTDCIEREVFEETGLRVKVGELLHVFEFYNVHENSHKVECYFLASLEGGALSSQWKDLGGEVKNGKFCTLEEICQQENVFPAFLKKGTWLSRGKEKIYQGLELKK